MKLRVVKILFLLTLALSSGCQRRDPIVEISVADQIAEYLNGAELGRELFRSQGIFLTDPYDMPFDDFVYRDSVISVSRFVNYGNTETLFYSEFDARGVVSVQITVQDQFRMRTIKTLSSQVDTLFSQRVVTRSGWFLKNGDEFDPFYGWILWGFNGTVSQVPVDVSCTTTGGLAFQGDDDLVRLHKDDFNEEIGRYILIRDIKSIPAGDRVFFEAKPAGTTTTRYVIGISGKAEIGLERTTMSRITNDLYRDTVKTLIPNESIWNLLHFEAYRNDSYFYIRSWLIPYRVPEEQGF